MSVDLLRLFRALGVALAVIGAVAGADIFLSHVRSDPLADVHAYYDAAARLNAGQPLYPAGADTNAADFYRYPPLLAILFRPLALLPFEAAAAIWEIVVVAAVLLTIRRLGVRRPSTWIAAGILAIGIGWTVSIGQAQAVVTLLLTLGTPLSVALAGHLKLFPILVGIYWVGRRDWRSVGRLAAWTIGLGAVQLILDPTSTLAFVRLTNLGEVGAVNNLSPYAVSPVLWAVLVAAGALAALRRASSRWGWAAAVALSVLATPRLLSYMLMSLMAGLRHPDEHGASAFDAPSTIERPSTG